MKYREQRALVEEIDRDAILIEMKERLNTKEFGGLQLAGSLAGIGIRTNRLGKEKIYVKEWGGNDWKLAS